MPISLRNLNPASRFYLSKDETEWVELKILSEREMKDIRKKAFNKKSEYKQTKSGLQRIEYMDTNDDLLIDEINDLSIHSWYLLDDEGNEIPCTRENKLLLINESPEFSAFIAKSLEKLREDKDKKDKEEEKN